MNYTESKKGTKFTIKQIKDDEWLILDFKGVGIATFTKNELDGLPK